MITVLIVGSNPRLGHLVGDLLDGDRRFRRVGEVSSVPAALGAAKLRAPDVVLVASSVDGCRGDALCAALRSVCPAAALLLWPQPADEVTAAPPQHVDGALEDGTTYFELARAVRDAYRRRSAPRVVDLTEPSRTTPRV